MKKKTYFKKIVMAFFVFSVVCALMIKTTNITAYAANISDSLKSIENFEETVPSQLAAEGINEAQWTSIQSQINTAKYHFTWQKSQAAAGYQAPNPDLGWGLTINEEKTQYEFNFDQENVFSLILKKFGGENLRASGITAERDQVIRSFTGITETITNASDGIYYQATIEASAAEKPTSLTYEINDLYSLRLLGEGNIIGVYDNEGNKVMQFDSITASDHLGSPVPANIEIADGTFNILFDTQNKINFPLTVQWINHSQTKVLAPINLGTGSNFGWAVAVSDETLVVGAKYEDDVASSAGTVYVFQRQQNGDDQWGQVQKLTASDAQANDNFGYAVDVSGGLIVVGAPGEDTDGVDAGAAYIFGREQGGASAWGQIKKITPLPSESDSGDEFGSSVSVWGDVIVVGAPEDDTQGSNAGAAYIFKRSSSSGQDDWLEVDRLLAQDAAAGDHFGHAVDNWGDVVVVGAPWEDGIGSLRGAAYVYILDEAPYSQVQKLTAGDTQDDDQFGVSVAVWGDVIVVGLGFEVVSPFNGAAYVFHRMEGGADNWGQVKKLLPADLESNDRFGCSVSVWGDVIVVGAWAEDSEGNNAGAAYVFHRMKGGSDNWGEVKKLTAQSGAADDGFGWSVAISGDVIVIGAPFTTGSNDGSGYVFQADADEWSEIVTTLKSDLGDPTDFSRGIAISGDVLVVGCNYNESLTCGAYVFHRMAGGSDQWELVQKLVPSNNETHEFGYRVVVSGDVIAIYRRYGMQYLTLFERTQGGADQWQETQMIPLVNYPWVSLHNDILLIGDREWNSDTGKVDMYYRMDQGDANWSLVKTLTGASTYDQFGWSHAVHNDQMVIGAASGLYIYDRLKGGSDNWGLVKLLTESDFPSGFSLFGTMSLALSNDTLAVGKSYDDTFGSYSGTVYILERDQGGTDNWGYVTRLVASDQGAYSTFGENVSISGDTIVVDTGIAPARDAERDGNRDGGLGVYVFHRNQGGINNWGEVQILHPPESGDYQAVISGGVIAVVLDQSVTIYQQRDIAGLSIDKTSSPNPVERGAALTYTISVTNNGPDPAENVEVSDSLPAGVTFQSASGNGWSCGEAGGTVTCTRATLAVGAAPDITIVITAPTSPGTISNSAFVSSTTHDPNPADNSDTEETNVVNSADLSLSKTSSPNPVVRGETLTYTLSVTNNGPDTATAVQVEDDLPAGVTFQSASGMGWSCSHASGTVTCTRATLAVGAAPDITIVVTAPTTPGTISNTAVVSSDDIDPEGSDNSDLEETTVSNESDLSLTKTASPNPVVRGETLTYTISVVNAGPDEATSVEVEDDLPAGVTFQSASGNGWSCGEAGGTVTCTRGTLAVGAAPDITIVVTAPTTPGTISNTAVVSSDDIDPESGDNSDPEETTVSNESDLSLSKTSSPNPVVRGETLTYTISVVNAGPDEATSVEVEDDLPPGVTFQSASGNGWSCGEAGGTVTCTRATLAVGAAPDITITVTAPSTPGPITNTAVVSAESIDDSSSDNSDPETTNVVNGADLSLTKTADPNPVSPGSQLTYTLTVTNHGPDTAANVVVTDDLADTLTLQLINAPGWTCTENATVVTCTLPSLANGDSSVIEIVVITPTGSFSSIENTADVSADELDPDQDNNTTDPVIVPENTSPDPAQAGLILTIAPETQVVFQHLNLDVLVSVENTGANEASDVLLTITPPAGLGFVSASGDGWSCQQVGDVVACERPSLPVGTAPDVILTFSADVVGLHTGDGLVSAPAEDIDITDNEDEFEVNVVFTGLYLPLVLGSN